MFARFAIVIVAVVLASPALAQTMDADAARRFVVGKMFAFNCYDGSRGAGRIYNDGSVIGTIQYKGAGPTRSMWMPAGTVRVKGESVCANLKGVPFEPCFNLTRTSDKSFRGSVWGMGFAYCDFTNRGTVAHASPRSFARKPVAVDPTTVATVVVPPVTPVIRLAPEDAQSGD